MELGGAANFAHNTITYGQIKTKPDHAVNLKPEIDFLKLAYQYAQQKPITPWLGADTAKHYQWYPFINIGHYELAKALQDKRRDTIILFYKKGIDKV